MIFLWRGLLLHWENYQVKKLGPSLRSLGQKLYKIGGSIQGDLFVEDRPVPSQRCVPVSESKFPKLLKSEWIAPNATIIGDVQTGKYSSIYHGVTLRGDLCKISIGDKTVIQDNTIIHNSDIDNPDAQVIIGDRVVIGVNCNIDSCRIDDKAMISDGATIHKGCHIQAGSMLAAGAVLPPNTTLPTGQIFAGNPAKYLRDLKPEETIAVEESSTELRELSIIMEEHTEKTHVEFIRDRMYKLKIASLTTEEIETNLAQEYGPVINPESGIDELGIEASNALDSHDEWENEGMMKYMFGNMLKKDNFDQYYEQDMTNYPDAFKIYGENYQKHDELRKKFETEIPGESPGWPNTYNPPTRPGAMRAWVSKWDPEYNTSFKQPGNTTENKNG